MIVRKPHGRGWRLCVDFRALNTKGMSLSQMISRRQFDRYVLGESSVTKPFEWTESSQTAFLKIKELIASDITLNHFDPVLPPPSPQMPRNKDGLPHFGRGTKLLHLLPANLFLLLDWRSSDIIFWVFQSLFILTVLLYLCCKDQNSFLLYCCKTQHFNPVQTPVHYSFPRY